MEQAYSAIGKAVLATQLLETVLVPIFEMHRVHTEPGRLGQTGGYIPAGAFKSPLANVVKILVSKEQIAPELENRILAFIDDRHSLIHRYTQEHGWPDKTNPDDFLPIQTLARRVETEALALAKILLAYMVKYAEPDWAEQNMDEFRARMAEIFLRAHLPD